jgi:hypothetical protein
MRLEGRRVGLAGRRVEEGARNGCKVGLTLTEGAGMPTFHFHQATTATPEQFVAALTDFGPGRGELFENSTDDYLEVHDQGPGEADVTEGSRGIWERLRYDWSDPNRIVLTTTDSNAWANGPSHTYNLKRNPDGTTDIDYDVVRNGRNLKGRFLGVVLGTVGKGRLEGAFEKFVKAIEARNGGTSVRHH